MQPTIPPSMQPTIPPSMQPTMQSFVPTHAIDWLLDNLNLQQEAEQLECRIIPDILWESSHQGGSWVDILRLHGCRTADVAKFSLELADQSGLPVYWIFEDIDCVSAGDGGGCDETEELEAEGNQPEGSDCSDDRNRESNSRALDEDQFSTGNKSTTDKTTDDGHEVTCIWVKPKGPATRKDELNVVSTTFKLTFEDDPDKMKAHRRHGTIMSTGRFTLQNISCSDNNYKIGKCTTITVFAKGDASRISIPCVSLFAIMNIISISANIAHYSEFPNQQDRNILKVIQHESSITTISSSIGNPFSFSWTRQKELNGSAAIPPFYTCRLPVRKSGSASIGIFPTSSPFSSTEPMECDLGLEISLFPVRVYLILLHGTSAISFAFQDASKRPKIDIGVKICLRMEMKLKKNKSISVKTGMVLVQTVSSDHSNNIWTIIYLVPFR
jgi:hypothetical protein